MSTSRLAARPHPLLAFAFRSLMPGDGWLARGSACLSGSRLVHVEPVFWRHCPRWDACSYRLVARNGEDKDIHAELWHTVSYVTKWQGKWPGTSCELNRPFSCPNGWTLLSVNDVTAEQAVACELFYLAQVGTPFDLRNYILLNCLLGKTRLQVDDEEKIALLRAGRVAERRPQGWFCSSLAAAALTHAGICAFPSVLDVTPDQIYEQLINKGATVASLGQ